jgi:RNA polymerase sigma factor (sigma-70 family)
MEQDVTIQTYRKLQDNNSPLPKKKQLKLAKRALSGEKGSRERLVYSCLGTIQRWARHYQRSGYDLEDRLQEGIQGALTALEEFRDCYNIKFSTWSFPAIRNAIQSAMINYNPSMNHGEDYRHPSPKIESREPERVQANTKTPLDITLENERITLLKNSIGETLRKLPKKYAEVIIARFGLSGEPPLDMKEISKRFNICRSTIHNYLNNGLEILRGIIGKDIPDLLSPS